jgi:polyhydroxyalkanoate synthase
MNSSTIPVNSMLKGFIEGLEKSRERILKSRDVLTGPLNTDISTTPCEIVYQEDRVKLKYYKPASPNPKVKTPLLMVYALINRETMLDLQPGRSVVENLLAQGI